MQRGLLQSKDTNYVFDILFTPSNFLASFLSCKKIKFQW